MHTSPCLNHLLRDIWTEHAVKFEPATARAVLLSKGLPNTRVATCDNQGPCTCAGPSRRLSSTREPSKGRSANSPVSPFWVFSWSPDMSRFKQVVRGCERLQAREGG